MTEHLPTLLLAWSIQMTGAFTPGPAVALIAGIALSNGRLPALKCAAGVGVGSIFLATATVLGLTALLAKVGDVMFAVRLLGAAYLAWLALKAFRNAARRETGKFTPQATRGGRHPARAGLMLQIANPKAILFYLAIAGVGGIGEAPALIKLVFVLGAFVISLGVHSGWGLALSSAPVRRAYAAGRRWIEGAFGCFFAYASYRLLMAKV